MRALPRQQWLQFLKAEGFAEIQSKDDWPIFFCFRLGID